MQNQQPVAGQQGARHLERKTMEVHGSLNLIGYGLSAIGGGVGVGLVYAAYINGVDRQQEAQRVLQPIAFLGLALTEALAILGLVFSFVIGA
jgi:F-type H+-transporting ATPase subunit c